MCSRGPWSWKSTHDSLNVDANEGGEDQRKYEVVVDGVKLTHCVTDLGSSKYVRLDIALF